MTEIMLSSRSTVIITSSSLVDLLPLQPYWNRLPHLLFYPMERFPLNNLCKVYSARLPLELGKNDPAILVHNALMGEVLATFERRALIINWDESMNSILLKCLLGRALFPSKILISFSRMCYPFNGRMPSSSKPL